MHIERATEDIYIFTSDRYAQVTASLIVSGNTGILIDAMPYPEEAAQIALLAHRRCPDGVRYIIYTGHEADHIYGAYLFPKAEVIAHSHCREQILLHGQKALNDTKAMYKEFEHVSLRIPSITFDRGTFTLRLPGKTLEIFPTPGHMPDSLSVLLHEERLLFAGDTVMAVPTIARGNIEQLRDSLNRVANMQLESIVQGHGEIILRGEIKEMMRRSINYLENLQAKVQKLVETGAARETVRSITIESCGLSRVLLNGVVVQLHTANALAIYDQMHASGRGSVAATPNAHAGATHTDASPKKGTAAKSEKAAKSEPQKTAPQKVAVVPVPSAKKVAAKVLERVVAKPMAKPKLGSVSAPSAPVGTTVQAKKKGR